MQTSFPIPNVDLGAIQAEQSLAGLPLTQALDKLGITGAFMQDARFETRGAQAGLASWALTELLNAGKTTNGSGRPITLEKVLQTIATKRYEGRLAAHLPRRAPEYAETKRQRAIRRKRLAALAKARAVQAKARHAAKVVDEVTATVRAIDGVTTAPQAAPPVTLKEVFKDALKLVDKIQLLDARLTGALR